jgi:poly-gamma-glutamate synthesis protein (capsule biosynthesis protein)
MIIVGDVATGNKFASVVFPILPCKKFLANLEGPLLSQNHSYFAIPKVGPSLYSSFLPQNISSYIFSLANNHTMDYGKAGLDTTINVLRQSGMHYCGAAASVSSAREPLIIQDRGISIGIISCCEAQFGVARNNQPGVAEFGPWIYKVIKNLSHIVDCIVVSVHAGVEDSPWPSPFIRDLYRSYIDAGATIIHGHHAHIPQGYEEYNDGLIFYGLGNFAVDPEKWNNYPNGLWSIGADINLNTKPLQWVLKTFEIRHKSGSKIISIEESYPEEHEEHIKYLELCNRPFHDEILFNSLWQEIAVRAFYSYGGNYTDFLPKKKSLMKIIKELIQISKIYVFRDKTGFNEIHKITQPKKLLYYHMIACESHRQMLVTALGVLSGEIEDLRDGNSRLLVEKMAPTL